MSDEQGSISCFRTTAIIYLQGNCRKTQLLQKIQQLHEKVREEREAKPLQDKLILDPGQVGSLDSFSWNVSAA
jgi:hypothetical protein